MFGLFENYDQVAQATILSIKHISSATRESSVNVVTVKYEFVLDVKPEHSEPFRTTIRQRLPAMISAPQQGAVVNVKYNAKTKKARLHLEGDVRYDLNMLVQAQRLDAQKRQEAIRNTPVGTPLSAQSREAQDAVVQDMIRRRAENKPPTL